jgi:hypothetical protein
MLMDRRFWDGKDDNEIMFKRSLLLQVEVGDNDAVYGRF